MERYMNYIIKSHALTYFQLSQNLSNTVFKVYLLTGSSPRRMELMRQTKSSNGVMTALSSSLAPPPANKSASRNGGHAQVSHEFLAMTITVGLLVVWYEGLYLSSSILSLVSFQNKAPCNFSQSFFRGKGKTIYIIFIVPGKIKRSQVYIELCIGVCTILQFLYRMCVQPMYE